MFKKLMLIGGIALATTAAHADGFPKTVDITTGVSAGYTFSGNTGNPGATDDLDDYASISGNVRHYMTDHVSLGAFASYGELDTKNLDRQVDVAGFGAGARFHLDDFAYQGIRPVMGAGVVFTRFNTGDPRETKTEKAVYVEAIAESAFAGRWIVETGIRGSLETRNAFFDTQIFAGVSLILGNKTQ
jgi:hypothetical protein